MRFLVLTSVIVAASTALAGAQPDELWQSSSDRAPAAVCGGSGEQDAGRRTGTAPPIAALGQVPDFGPVASAVPFDDLAPPDRGAALTAVISFAPKTSPPLSR